MLVAGHFGPPFSLARSIRLVLLLNFWLSGINIGCWQDLLMLQFSVVGGLDCG